MAERSKRIAVYDAEKIKLINPETLSLLRKYEIDLSLRELSENTLKAYRSDLYQWWIYVYDFQGNKPVTEIDEDDLTEFFFYCKQQRIASERYETLNKISPNSSSTANSRATTRDG